jgi:phage repressor protein C with HTH and peptisase S24 domain
MKISERLKTFLDARGMKSAELSIVSGVSESRISDILNDVTKNPRSDTLIKLAKGLNIPFSEFIGEGEMKRESTEASAESCDSRTVPVYHLAGAGTPRLAELEPVAVITVSERLLRPSLVVIQIKGDSMERTITDGAIVGIDTFDKDVISGKMYAVWIPDEGAVVKRIYRQTDAVILRSDNGEHPEERITADKLGDSFILGRVKWWLNEGN